MALAPAGAYKKGKNNKLLLNINQFPHVLLAGRGFYLGPVRSSPIRNKNKKGEDIMTKLEIIHEKAALLVVQLHNDNIIQSIQEAKMWEKSLEAAANCLEETDKDRASQYLEEAEEAFQQRMLLKNQ